MEVRLIARDDEEQRSVTGKILRVTRTRIQVRAPDGLLHWCNRHNGSPLGQKSAYSIHPDDVALIQSPEADAMKSAAPRKQTTGFSRHWNV